jgi:uncharacterized protein
MPPLYTASVPVFLHYLARLQALAARASAANLQARLAPDMFTGGQQMATAAGFALRVAFPLAGHAVPKMAAHGVDGAGLAQSMADVTAQLTALDPADFAGAEARMIAHRAGFADLRQTGADFLHLFGMPNFIFHTAMGFAVLRAEGLEIGKADFDGLHDYPAGFRF